MIPEDHRREVLAELPLEGQVESHLGWGSFRIRLPVRAERITLDRETVVAEEVLLEAEQVEDVAHVTGTVRREELGVDVAGDLYTSRPMPRG